MMGQPADQCRCHPLVVKNIHPLGEFQVRIYGINGSQIGNACFRYMWTRIQNIHWEKNTIEFVTQKTGKSTVLPLTADVGNAKGLEPERQQLYLSLPCHSRSGNRRVCVPSNHLLQNKTTMKCKADFLAAVNLNVIHE